LSRANESLLPIRFGADRGGAIATAEVDAQAKPGWRAARGAAIVDSGSRGTSAADDG
jgi:hypothetical protein